MKLSENSFLRDVLKLSFGTVGGRLITLAALPLVTRLYSPEDFALLAIYLGLVTTIAVAACLRFEIAIPLAEDDENAANLLALALVTSTGVAVILMVVSVLVPQLVATKLGYPELAPYLWLVPLGVITAAVYSALLFWSTRVRRFGSIARSRLSQAVMGVGTMVGLGWMGMTPLGLLLGNILNNGSGSARLGLEAVVLDRARLGAISFDGMISTLRAYRRYPIYSAPESLFTMAGIQMPVILIAAYAGAEAGFLFLAMRVMAAPMALLGSSISQVYLSRANEEKRAGRLTDFTLGIMRRLVIVGTGPLVLLGVLSPVVFPWLFGEDWLRAGVIVSWLVPSVALQFIVSPVSMVFFVTGQQRAMLVLSMIGLLQRVGSVALAIILGVDTLIIAFVLGSVAYYTTVLIFVTHSAGFGAVHYYKLACSLIDRRVMGFVLISIVVALATHAMEKMG